MKTQNKIFITDFDGTLLNSNRAISEKNLETLEKLHDHNVITAIATGRSVYSFDRALKQINLPVDAFFVDYVIFSTGAGIMNFPERRLMYQRDIPPLAVREIIDYLDRRQLDFMVLNAIPDTHRFSYQSHGRDNPDFYARIDLYKPYARPFDRENNPEQSATEVLAIIPGPADTEAVLTIRNALSGFSVIQATSPLDHKSTWIEIFNPDVSKSRAAAWLIKQLGITRKNVLSVGNDYNDQDLLAWSGKGFVVENAPAGLKQTHETVASNEQNGVTEAVEKSGWLLPVSQCRN